MASFKFQRDAVGVLSGESLVNQIEDGFTALQNVVDSTQNAVRVDEVQDFTDSQKEVGRSNIGVTSVSEAEIDTILNSLDYGDEGEDEEEESYYG